MKEALLAAAAIAAIAGTLTFASAVHANEFFQPFGGNDRLGLDSAPSLNSSQDRFNEQVDVYQSEINRSQRERAYWDTYMRNNLFDHSHTNDLPYAREY